MQANQEIDIISAMLTAVRESLGAIFTTDMERKIELQLRAAWGRQKVYIKEKQSIDVHARDLDIRKRYNMCNRRELMEQYQLSRGHFYKILKGA